MIDSPVIMLQLFCSATEHDSIISVSSVHIIVKLSSCLRLERDANNSHRHLACDCVAVAHIPQWLTGGILRMQGALIMQGRILYVEMLLGNKGMFHVDILSTLAYLGLGSWKGVPNGVGGGCEGGKLSHPLVRSATDYSQKKNPKHSPLNASQS